MSRRFLAVLALATLGFGLLGGPHPCAASHAQPENQPSSCHEAAGSSQDRQVRIGAGPLHEQSDCCDAYCQRACHMTAVAEGGPVVFSIAPVSEAVVEGPVSGLPLFAHPIDHVPLA